MSDARRLAAIVALAPGGGLRRADAEQKFGKATGEPVSAQRFKFAQIRAYRFGLIGYIGDYIVAIPREPPRARSLDPVPGRSEPG